MKLLAVADAVPFGGNGGSSFDDVFLPHFDSAYNLARWLTRNPWDAEDVVQEAYMRAFKYFGGFNGGDSRSWLLRIVRNTCYSWLQRNRTQQFEYEFAENVSCDKTPSPEIQLIQADEYEALRRNIDALPARFREVVVLRDIEGLSYKEIATVVGVPVGTVMSRLSRARERLQKNLRLVANGE